MLTPKMSIRRHVVISTYDDIISDLYGRHGSAGGGPRDNEDRKAA